MLPWLIEPGLLTARVRACCVGRMQLNLLCVTPAALDPRLASRELARAAVPDAAREARLWARRKLYRLAGGPILVQEVFLPALYPT